MKGLGKRTLLGCIAALAAMLLLTLVTMLFGDALNRGIDTGIGTIAVIDLASTLVAMCVGGWVAKRGFAPVAVALIAASWLAIMTVLLLSASPSSPPPMASLSGLLQYNALAIVLSLLLAWAGAKLGERLATRQQPATQ